MKEIRKTWKQRLAFVLTMALILTSLNVSAFAAEVTEPEDGIVTEIIDTEQTEEPALTEEPEVIEMTEEESDAQASGAYEEVIEADEVADALAEAGGDVTSPLQVPEANRKFMQATMNSKGQIKVAWKKMNKSKYYKLYRFVSDYDGQGNEGFKQIADNGSGFTTKTSYIEKDALGDSVDSFVYKVVAYDKDKQIVEATEKAPNAVSVVCKPLALDLVAAYSDGVDWSASPFDGTDNGKPSFDFTFEQVKGNHITYEIYRNKEKIKTISENDCEVIDNYSGKGIKSSHAVALVYTDDSGTVSLGEKYSYQVKAVFTLEAGKAVESLISSTKKAKSVIGKPYLCTAYNVSANKIEIAFNAIKDASSYEIFYSNKENGSYKRVSKSMLKKGSVAGGVIDKSYVDSHPFDWSRFFKDDEISNDIRDDDSIVKGWTYVNFPMKPEQNFYYKVRAVAGKSAGAFSDVDYDMTHLGMVKDPMATNIGKNGVIELSFEKVDYATKYQVYRNKIENGVAGNYEKLSYLRTPGLKAKNGYVYIKDKRVDLGSVYSYKIMPMIGNKECTHNGGVDNCVSSNEIKVTAIGPTPVASSYSLRKIKAKWSPFNKKAIKYTVRYSTDPTFATVTGQKDIEKRSDEFNKRYCIIDGLTPGVKYYTELKVWTDEENSTDWSDPSNGVRPIPRTIEEFNVSYDTSNSNGAKLTWSRAYDPEVDLYRIEYSKDGGSYHVLTNTRARSHRTNVTNGVEYTYRIAGVYEGSTEVIGKWKSDTYSTPYRIALENQKLSVINGNQMITIDKGKQETIGVKYYKHDNSTTFDPTQKSISWDSSTPWINVKAKDSGSNDYNGVVSVSTGCPAGTYRITARAINHDSDNYRLTKTFYVIVK